MWKTVLLYALALAALIFVLKFIEYNYIIRDLSLEFYIGFVAILCTVVGVWAGLRLTSKKTIPPNPVLPFQLDEEKLKVLGISKREHEVLELIASGMTNQEIADKLFVSLNTVKTHLSNLFVKLDVKRRTQAIQKAKALRLIP